MPSIKLKEAFIFFGKLVGKSRIQISLQRKIVQKRLCLLPTHVSQFLQLPRTAQQVTLSLSQRQRQLIIQSLIISETEIMTLRFADQTCLFKCHSFISSVRSSNSHPDLLLTHHRHPTHFFRSHRSSTLDFHFLSHYSYIKAIKLYKGNQWTHLLAICIPYGYNRTSLQDSARQCKIVQDSARQCKIVQDNAKQ